MRTIGLLTLLTSTLAAAQVESAPPLVEVAPEPLPSSNGLERFKLQGKLIPAGYHLVSSPRWALIGAGAAAFAAGYGASMAFGVLTNDFTGFVPLAGPVMQTINAWQWSDEGQGWTGLGRGIAAFFYTCLTLTEVAAQVAGLVLVVVGSASQQQWLERDVETKPAAKPSVMVMPIVRQDSVGLGLTGRF
jgi:hypothetical protein